MALRRHRPPHLRITLRGRRNWHDQIPLRDHNSRRTARQLSPCGSYSCSPPSNSLECATGQRPATILPAVTNSAARTNIIALGASLAAMPNGSAASVPATPTGRTPSGTASTGPGHRHVRIQRPAATPRPPSGPLPTEPDMTPHPMEQDVRPRPTGRLPTRPHRRANQPDRPPETRPRTAANPGPTRTADPGAGRPRKRGQDETRTSPDNPRQHPNAAPARDPTRGTGGRRRESGTATRIRNRTRHPAQSASPAPSNASPAQVRIREEHADPNPNAVHARTRIRDAPGEPAGPRGPEQSTARGEPAAGQTPGKSTARRSQRHRGRADPGRKQWRGLGAGANPAPVRGSPACACGTHRPLPARPAVCSSPRR